MQRKDRVANMDGKDAVDFGNDYSRENGDNMVNRWTVGYVGPKKKSAWTW